MTDSVTIEKLVYGGDGLTRLKDGPAVFVPFVAPEDEVVLTPIQKNKGRHQAKVQTLTKPSSQRTEPVCDVFGICGGCQWQHLGLDSQRHWKKEIVSENLARIGKLKDVSVSPISDIGPGYRYRNKVEWVRIPNSNPPQFGYHGVNPDNVIRFNTCHLISDEMNEVYDAILADSSWFTTVSRIQVRQSASGQIILGLIAITPPAENWAVDAWARAIPGLSGIWWQSETSRKTIWGNARLIETVADRKYRVSTGSFFQVNKFMADPLVEAVRAALEAEPEDTLLDAYSGVGLFSISMASSVKRVIALETSGDAVEDARFNALENGLTNIEVIAGSVEKTLTELDEEIDIAVIDPPRAGCLPEVLTRLAEIVQKKLVYVSCDPATLARDLAILEKLGWSVQNVQPLDLFPQTYHVETVVTLA